MRPPFILRRRSSRTLVAVALAGVVLAACSGVEPSRATSPHDAPPLAPSQDSTTQGVEKLALDAQLRSYLTQLGFTGRIASTLEERLGRTLDPRLADIGRNLWFDTITGLNDDNTCAGCHSPTNGFGDTQPIAIGIDNNGIVGPGRIGPRNQRRAPMMANTAFYPTLMWNSRFRSLSGDPFDNSAGFQFPPPEGQTLSYLPHLLTAQAFLPPTERTEAAGFHFPGDNFAIRAEVVRRLNSTPGYRRLFASVFPDVRAGGPITFEHVARAIAEFELSQVYANAPIDRYARGDESAMTVAQKQGAVLFFGRAGCVQCHAVSGQSNEMFSDFREHVAGVPQLVPSFGNVVFDGPAANEDFGLEQATGDSSGRYAFRTSPLRNVALQSAFMHDGAFVRLDDAMRYHLDAVRGAAAYSTAGLPADLRGPIGPIGPILARLDPGLRKPVKLTDVEFQALVAFVREGLLDPAAKPERLRRLVPPKLPSGRQGLTFQFR